MRVNKLALEDFRNYSSAEIQFQPGCTLFLGRNGQGKTNLVEAINYASIQASHRISKDAALIRKGSDSAIIRLSIQLPKQDVDVDYQINRVGGNRVQVNKKATTVRQARRFFKSVLFAPEDLGIVRGEPGNRRRFIDELMIQLSPRFAALLGDYEKALKQRNALLKSARAQRLRKMPETMSLWTEQLVDYGSQVIIGRVQVTRQLMPLVEKNYQYLVENNHKVLLDLNSTISAEHEQEHRPFLIPDAEIAEMFHVKLVKQERNELDRGQTLVGPHRDDLYFGLNDLPVRGYASHGESWSFALALRLASAELLAENAEFGDPVILLDDVFAELDAGRREKLALTIKNFDQVIITAAVAEDVPENLSAKIVSIAAGAVLPEAGRP